MYEELLMLRVRPVVPIACLFSQSRFVNANNVHFAGTLGNFFSSIMIQTMLLKSKAGLDLITSYKDIQYI